MFLRDRPSDETSDDSHTILACVLDDSHERGLWIELDTEKDLKDTAGGTAGTHDSMAGNAGHRGCERFGCE